jgi:transcriptional regulator with XRE-family HTH domain
LSSNNRVKEIREKLGLSKAALARRAGISALTVTRVESGKALRLETKRRILLGLGYGIAEKSEVFPRE